MSEVFLLLGSNLGNRMKMLDSALHQIAARIGKVKKQSSVYESEPWGTSSPLPFLNRVLVVETDLLPKELLNEVLSIETDLGRIRTEERNQPRTIDIDILLYDEIIMQEDDLIVPHERMHLRQFVLVPLNELIPERIHPVCNLSFNELLKQCTDTSWVKKLEN